MQFGEEGSALNIPVSWGQAGEQSGALVEKLKVQCLEVRHLSICHIRGPGLSLI